MELNQTPGESLRLAEMIAALSLTTDLGMGLPMELGLRSCVFAVHLGESLGLDTATLSATYYLALLRLVGCTADAHDVAAVFGDELAARAWMSKLDYTGPPSMLSAMVQNHGAGESLLRRGQMLATAFARMPRMMHSTQSHCEVAERLADRLGLDAVIQQSLWQAFERWDGKGMPNGLKGEAIALPMRVVQLAQDTMIFYQAEGIDAALTVARERAGGSFDPAMVECYCSVAPRLLPMLAEQPAWETVLAAEPGARPQLSETEIDTAVRALADYADLKTPFTAGHSSGVAELAAEAARRCRLPDADVITVWRAGMLHDLGRTGVSAAIWCKPGPLSEGERERVRLHPYYTERVLSRSQALSQLGALAALHHERIDGSGYHRGLPGTMLPPTARILAAADVYHAMTEPRPHRPALSPEAAADELRAEVRAGRLDDEAVNAVLAATGHRVRTVRRERVAGLSDREIEVLRLLARGLSNKQMAERLSISKDTVGHHIRHIYDKIDVSTRAGATFFAMQHGLVDDTVELAVS